MTARPDLQKINQRKTDHGNTAFFSKGGSMAKANPFAGKESAKEEKAEKGKAPMFVKGQKPKFFAAGGSVSRDGVASRGKTKGKTIVMKKGGKC